MDSFTALGLPQPLLHALDRIKFHTPTPIQAKAIPVALAGRDILGSAQTGTGKTGAFAIPLLARLLENPNSTALVLTPTRELAVQVMQTIQQMIDRAAPIRTALLIGGEPMPKQFKQLQHQPRIVVGTPGRINDHLTRNTLQLGRASFLVLDETDRMLDMGFGIQIDKILNYLPKQRQTLMFSATLPANIVKMSERYLKNPERIAIGETSAPAQKIRQETVHTSSERKYDELVTQLDQRTGSIIVFVKTKHGADRLARKLAREKHSAEAIHGDLRQNRRDRVIREFREKKHRIMVATDVAARGLDIPHIEHVINYDLPQCPEDYIHRIGRTARAGAEGVAVSLITPDDSDKWQAIHYLLNPHEKPRRPQHQPNRNGKTKKPGGRPFHRHKKRPGGERRYGN